MLGLSSTPVKGVRQSFDEWFSDLGRSEGFAWVG